MKLQKYLFAIAIVLAAVAAAIPAEAHHVVWLDFSNFNLNSYPTVNGSAPSTSDVSAVRAQIIANMAEDYAAYDLYFSEFKPNYGRYTKVKFLGVNQGGLFGCAGPDCCPSGGECSGIGTWDDMTESSCEVYAGSFATSGSFSGANATTARIASGLSGTASHELGHVLDLTHCRAADDSLTLGCSGITSNTNDQNPRWHIMASGSSWGLTMNERATRDRFFSVHASRRILYSNLQAKNHGAELGNINGGAGWADLIYGRLQSPTMTTWYGRRSLSNRFGNWTTLRTDAGDAGDLFYTADVTGDNRSDLIYGRILSANQVRWYVRPSTGTGFGNWSVWRNDAGAAGDIFRLADINGDGRHDLVYGRPLSSTTMRWWSRLSTGSSFGSWTLLRSDAGGIGDVFLFGDVDADGDDDLAYGQTVSSTQVKWYVRKSNGSTLGGFNVFREDAGDDGDLFYLSDTGGDGDADLLYGRALSDFQVRWYYRPSFGNSFGNVTIWKNDAGDAGDLFRLGDGNGDGFVDIFYARPLGMTSRTSTPNLGWIRWYGRLSLGGSFGPWSTWASDAGDEGDTFP